MIEPHNWMMKVLVFLVSFSLFSCKAPSRRTSVTSAKTPELYFNVLPSKQLFSLGEDVVIVLELYSRSEQPILVSRLQGDEFVTFKVIGPDGNEVPRHDGVRTSTTTYSAADFSALGQYSLVSAKRIISLEDGSGFVFDKPGQYRLTAEFSMGAPENLTPFAGQAKPATGTFQSGLAFCIEACILEPLQVRNNASKSALKTVREFYTYLTRHQQLGIPSGRARKDLRPLLSKRLAQQLDSLEACDKDYYRRYGEILRAKTYKPATPWLEEGLFTGPNDAATPRVFRILGSRAIGENRVDVELEFTTKQTYSPNLGVSPSYEHYEGDVTAILENNRWVVDDYVAMYENHELRRLSAGYPECEGGQWAGDRPY